MTQSLWETLQQVEIAKDKIGLCAYHNLGIASSQLFEQPSGTVEFFFIRIVTVRHRPYYNTFTVVFMRIRYRLPVFTSKNVPHGSVCPVNRFMNDA